MNVDEKKNFKTNEQVKKPLSEHETNKTGQRHGGIDKKGKKEKDQTPPS